MGNVKFEQGLPVSSVTLCRHDRQWTGIEGSDQLCLVVGVKPIKPTDDIIGRAPP